MGFLCSLLFVIWIEVIIQTSLFFLHWGDCLGYFLSGKIEISTIQIFAYLLLKSWTNYFQNLHQYFLSFLKDILPSLLKHLLYISGRFGQNRINLRNFECEATLFNLFVMHLETRSLNIQFFRYDLILKFTGIVIGW